MRNFFLSLFLGITFLIAGFILVNTPDLSIFDKDKLNELIDSGEIEPGQEERLNSEIQQLIDRGLIIPYLSPNFFLIDILILSGVFCFIYAVHLLIDKLFFREFYQNPSNKIALRRAAIITIVIFSLRVLRLYRVEFQILIIPIFIGGIIEFLVWNMNKANEVENIAIGEGEENISEEINQEYNFPFRRLSEDNLNKEESANDSTSEKIENNKI